MILWQKLSSKLTCMILIIILSLFLFVACYNKNATNISQNSMLYSEEDEIEEFISEYIVETSPTGLTDGMITPPQIMYQGIIYKYRFFGKMNNLPDKFDEVGTILVVDDYNNPNKDFGAGGRELNFSQGQQVYASEDDNTRIAVLCDDGYYMFYRDDIE